MGVAIYNALLKPISLNGFQDALVLKIRLKVGEWRLAIVLAVMCGAFDGTALAQMGERNDAVSLPLFTLEGPTRDGAGSGGAFTRTLPIQTPPGRAGLQPNLALVYSSDASNGLAGVGWGLAGLPGIVRMNFGMGLRYDLADTYAFVGGFGDAGGPDTRLVFNNSDYRTRVDTLRRFQPSAAQCGGGPCYWTMRDGYGTTYSFGGTSANHDRGTGTHHAVVWERNNGAHSANTAANTTRGIWYFALQRVEDADGNFYDVRYTNDGITLRPERIRYNQGGRRRHEIHFRYEDRRDTTPVALHHHRLREVLVQSCALRVCSVIRKYVLRYNLSATARSLLAGVAECGDNPGPGVCGDPLPEQTFEYTESGIPETMVEYDADWRPLNPSDRWQSMVGDVNGDGRQDLVRCNTDPYFVTPRTEAEAKITFSIFPGAYLPQLGRIAATLFGWGIGYTGPAQITDHRYVAQFVLGAPTDPQNGFARGIVTAYDEPRCPELELFGVPCITKQTCVLADVNGDGYDDLTHFWERSDPAQQTHAFETRVSHGSPGGLQKARSYGDTTFDRGRFTQANTATFWLDFPSSFLTFAADINGDMVSDLIFLAPQQRYLLYQLAAGDGAPKTGPVGGFGPLTWAGGTSYAASASAAPASSWELCREAWDDEGPGYHINVTGVFAGGFPLDHDGDGYSDVGMAFYRQEVGIPHTNYSLGGLERYAIAKSNRTGLSGVRELCYPSVIGRPPEGLFPWKAFRGGDINGDGRSDVMTVYKGQASIPPIDDGGQFVGSAGMVTGQHVTWLPGERFFPDPQAFIHQQSAQPLPGQAMFASHDDYIDFRTGTWRELPLHFDNWEILIGDIDGDGIDDQVHFYRGELGCKIEQKLGTPLGHGLAWQTVPSHAECNEGVPYNDAYERDNVSHRATLADVNGDGMKDLVFTQFPHVNGPPTAYVVLGRAGGFYGDGVDYSRAKPLAWNLGRDYHPLTGSMHLMPADINGDGKQDVVIVNDHNGHDRIGLWNASTSRVSFILNADTRRPDLMRAHHTGLGGTTSAEYESAVDHTGILGVPAVWNAGSVTDTRIVGSCNARDGVTGEIILDQPNADGCGIPDKAARPLLVRLTMDGGSGGRTRYSIQSTTFHYANARLRPGTISVRHHLGFARRLRVRDQDYFTIDDAFRQDSPLVAPHVAGTLYRTSIYAGCPTADTSGKCVALPDPANEMTGDRLLQETVYTYNARNAANLNNQPHQYFYVIELDAVRVSTHDAGAPLDTYTQEFLRDAWSNPVFVTETVDGGDAYVTTRTYETGPASQSAWIVHRLSSERVQANSGFVGSPIVSWVRYAYDRNNLLRLTNVRRLLFEQLEGAVCTNFANLCQADVTARRARWVSVFNNPVYNANGTLKSYRDARGFTTSYTYEAAYQAWPETITDPLQHTTTITYLASGLVDRVTDPNRQTTRYQRDALGRLASYHPPLRGLPRDGQESWSYHWTGATPYTEQIVRTSAGGDFRIVRTYFDGFGRALEERTLASDGCEVRNYMSGGFAYNSRYITSRSTPACYTADAPDTDRTWIRLAYDLAGRLSTEQIFDDSASPLDAANGIGDENAVPLATPFAVGRSMTPSGDLIVDVADAESRFARHTFDGRGRLIKTLDAEGKEWTYGYNFAGLRDLVTKPQGWHTSRIDRTFYDGWGRVRATFDPLRGTRRYERDDTDNVTAVVDGLGRRVTYQYDAIGRLTAVVDASLATDVTFAYDSPLVANGIGRLASVWRRGVETVDFDAYDTMGRYTSRTHQRDVDGQVQKFTHNYDYDWAGNRTSHVFPTNFGVSASQTWLWDSKGQLRRIEIRDGVHRYDAVYSEYLGTRQARRREIVDVAAGRALTTTTYGFDERFRLKDLMTTSAAGDAVQAYAYTYDAAGNVLRLTDGRTNQSLVVTSDETETYTYDRLNRLRTATSADATREYRYDAQGFLTRNWVVPASMPAGVPTEQIYTVGRAACSGLGVWCVNGGQGTGWHAYYDAMSNRTRLIDEQDVDWNYDYDSFNQLTKVSRHRPADADFSTHLEMLYAYNGERAQQIRTHDDGSATTALWIGEGYEVRSHTADAHAHATTRTYLGPEGMPIAIVTDGATISGQPTGALVASAAGQPLSGDPSRGAPQGIYFLLENHLGSVAQVVKPNGDEVTRYRYSPYGEVLRGNSLGLDLSTRKFTGQELDQPQLAHHGARYYDPVSSLWLSGDAVESTETQGLNRVGYVLGNPLRYIDRDGYQAQETQPPPVLLQQTTEGSTTIEVWGPGSWPAAWERSGFSSWSSLGPSFTAKYNLDVPQTSLTRPTDSSAVSSSYGADTRTWWQQNGFVRREGIIGMSFAWDRINPFHGFIDRWQRATFDEVLEDLNEASNAIPAGTAVVKPITLAASAAKAAIVARFAASNARHAEAVALMAKWLEEGGFVTLIRPRNWLDIRGFFRYPDIEVWEPMAGNANLLLGFVEVKTGRAYRTLAQRCWDAYLGWRGMPTHVATFPNGVP